MRKIAIFLFSFLLWGSVSALDLNDGGGGGGSGGSGISNVVDDTTPQLGGNLDVNGKTITSASNGNISITPNGTGKVTIGTAGIIGGTPVEEAEIGGDVALPNSNAYKIENGVNNNFISVLTMDSSDRVIINGNPATATGVYLSTGTGQNVGIGQLSASDRLDVAGNIISSGTITATGGGFIGDGSGITSLDATVLSGVVPSSTLDTSSVTKQGNTFNGASQLVQLDGSGLLPALDGSALTNLTGVADDLGNHIATTTLNMNGFGISNAESLAISGDGTGISKINSGTNTVTNFIVNTSTPMTVNPSSVTFNTTGLYDSAGYRLDHATLTYTVILSSGTGFEGKTFDLGPLSLANDTTITQIDATALPTGATVLFQLDERTLAAIGSAGTDVFSVTDTTATSPGATYTSFSNAGITAGSSLVLTTPLSSASAGSAASMRVSIFYKEN